MVLRRLCEAQGDQMTYEHMCMNYEYEKMTTDEKREFDTILSQIGLSPTRYDE